MRSAWERLLSLVATLVLARLLVPHDFGVAAIVLSATAVATIIVDGGITSDFVRREEAPTVERFRAARRAQFTLAGIVIPGAAVLIPVAPQFGLLLLIDMLQLLTDPLMLQPKVMLQRSMQFSGLALADGLGVLARAVTSLAIAAVHRGPAALVLGDLSAALVYALVVARHLGPKADQPTAGEEIRPITTLREGAPFQIFSLVINTRELSSSALVGGVLGLRTLGLLQFAYRVLSPVLVIFTSLAQLGIPIGAHVTADNPGTLRRTRQGYLLSGIITTIVLTTIAAPAQWLVPVVFGQQWAKAVPLIFAIALALVITGPANTFGWGLLLAADHARLCSMAALSCTLFFLGSLVVLQDVAAKHALAVALILFAVSEALTVVIACRRLLRIRLGVQTMIPVPIFLVAYVAGQELAEPFNGWLAPSAIAAATAATATVLISLPLTWRSAHELIRASRSRPSPIPTVGAA
jgi:O-antigen/teichoic acid export membrane protein